MSVRAVVPAGTTWMIGTTQDVTERKREEEERREFHAHLQEAQKLESLGILAGGVAHDFNNLLTGILGNASLAREIVPAESELHEFLRPIEKSAEHAAQLCQQMLAYAGKGGAGRPAARKSNLPMIAAGVGAVVVLGGIGAVVALSGGKKPAAQAPGATAGAAAPAAADTGRASEKVRRAIEASLPGVACTWLDIDSANDDGAGGVSLRLSGVAGSPVAAQAAVQKVAAGTGAKVGLIDTSNVFPVAPATCAALDSMRQFREPNSDTGRRIATQQSNWELMKEAPPCNGPNAKVVVDVKTDPAQDFSILGFDRKGGLQQIFDNRAALEAVKTQAPDLVTDKGAGAYSTTACYNETGLVGEVLLTGKGPFPVDLPNALKTDQSKVVDAAWLKAFADKARAGGWKTSMVWYRVVNDQS